MSTTTFFEELHGTYGENPVMPYERVIGYAAVELQRQLKEEVKESSVYLAFIKTVEQGIGAGSAALQIICDLADKHNVSIDLTVCAVPHHARNQRRAMNNAQLRKWYARNGFVRTGCSDMTRYPKPLGTAQGAHH